MPLLPVDQMVDIVPDARRAVAQVRRALLIQQHDPAAIQRRAKIAFQMRDALAHIHVARKVASLHGVVESGYQIPVGLQAAAQVGADLRDHLLQLIGALVDRQLHQGAAHVVDAPHQRQHQNHRKRHGQKVFQFLLSHMTSTSTCFCPLRPPQCRVM